MEPVPPVLSKTAPPCQSNRRRCFHQIWDFGVALAIGVGYKVVHRKMRHPQQALPQEIAFCLEPCSRNRQRRSTPASCLLWVALAGVAAFHIRLHMADCSDPGEGPPRPRQIQMGQGMSRLTQTPPETFDGRERGDLKATFGADLVCPAGAAWQNNYECRALQWIGLSASGMGS